MLKINFKIAAVVAALALYGCADDAGKYGLGTKVDKEVYKAWVINVEPTSKNLPKGSGTVHKGEELYQMECAACHGASGEGAKLNQNDAAFPRLIGKNEILTGKDATKNVGNYWPYASTLYDYIHRAMPITSPQSLAPSEVYSLVAYILYENGVIKKDMVVDNTNLNSIKMPNQDGFICDERPDVTGSLCMDNCITPNDKKFDASSDKKALSKIEPLPKSDCYLR